MATISDILLQITANMTSPPDNGLVENPIGGGSQSEDSETVTTLPDEEPAPLPSDEEPAPLPSDEEPAPSPPDEEPAPPPSDEEPASSPPDEEDVPPEKEEPEEPDSEENGGNSGIQNPSIGKNEEEKESEDETDSDESETESSTRTPDNISVDEGLSLPVIGGIAVGVVAVAIIAAVLARKFKKTSQNNSRASVNENMLTEPMKPVPDFKIYNIQSIGKRSSQQDSFGTSNINDKSKGVLSIVADGMGGIANGADMSKLVVSTMLNDFDSVSSVDNPSEFLLGSITHAQNAARSKIPPGQMSGSTVVAVYMKDDNLYFGSVGDSRIVLYREGSLAVFNREHTLAAELDEKAARGQISLEDARSEKQRTSLTSYIGTSDRFMIDRNLRAFKLLPGDIILLMSDGVFGSATDDELISALRTGNLKTAGDMITGYVNAKQKPNQDNFTAILLKY